MTPEQALVTIETMSDQELREFMHKAEIDHAQAASTEIGSEWQQSCFAALYCGCVEANKRGLKPIAQGVLQ